MLRNVVLIGMMGCGKTTVGGLLAQRFGWPLADTDILIEQQQKCTVQDIFRDFGEARFRELELELCQELSGQQGLVIACGGGLPLQDEAIDALKTGGLVFWLNVDPGSTYDALDVSGRPLAQAGKEDFINRYAARAPIYRRWADYTIPCADDPQTVAAHISAIYTEVSQL